MEFARILRKEWMHIRKQKNNSISIGARIQALIIVYIELQSVYTTTAIYPVYHKGAP